MIVIPLRPLLPGGFDQGLSLVEGDLVLCLVLALQQVDQRVGCPGYHNERIFTGESLGVAGRLDVMECAVQFVQLVTTGQAPRTYRASVKNTT